MRGHFFPDILYIYSLFYLFQGEPFYIDSQVICPNAADPVESKNTDPHPPSGTRRSISYKPGTKKALPFSPEVTSSLPTFCFPDGGYIYNVKQNPQINFLVLTNMEGMRTYAISITVYCQFAITESTTEKGHYTLIPDPVPEASAGTSNVYVPLCICLVSSFPYLNTLKGCLSALIPQIEGRVISEVWRPVMKLSTVVTTIPVPPPGPLAVEFSLFGSSHTIHPASEAGRRVIDMDLQVPLLIFRPEDLVKLVSCFLTQQRMVFVSSTYPLLTLVIEALFTFMDPIIWRLTYVPVLPNTLGDLMEAPGPFIMGVHSSLRNKVKQIRRQPETPSIVLIDIDKGVIDIDDRTNVPDMPDTVSQSLLVRLRKASAAHQIKLATMPTQFCYESMVEQRRELSEQTNIELKEAFLDMLVSMFGDIFNHMIVGERYFDKTEYLKSRHDDERSFFIEVSSTDAFERFVDERMEHHDRRDAFAVLGERIAQQRKSPSRSRSSSILHTHLHHLNPIFKPVTERFTVPMFMEESLSNGRFYSIYCKSLTQRLKELGNGIKDIRLKACFLYLRGFVHIARDMPIEALRDFHALYALSLIHI